MKQPLKTTLVAAVSIAVTVAALVLAPEPERNGRGLLPARLAASFGWEEHSWQARSLSRFLEEESTGQRDYVERLQQAEGDGRGAAARTFNAAADRRRQGLVETFGAATAEQIGLRIPLYRADEQTGELVRVTASGVAMPNAVED